MIKTQQMTTSLTAGEQDLLVIRDIRNGDTAAYEQIMRRYNRQLYRIGIAYLGVEALVEDVMQNTYLKAWYHLPQFKADAAFSTWLIRIMINECKQAIRRKEKERVAYREYVQDKNVIYDQGIQKSLMQKEMKEMMQQAILQLPTKYRTVFICREVEMLSTEETAACLEISAQNVKVRLLRAKAMIRKQLSETIAGQELFEFFAPRCDKIVISVMEQLNIEQGTRNVEFRREVKS
jgi:RNA polymerase sigma factor (sigma-70 family)